MHSFYTQQRLYKKNHQKFQFQLKMKVRHFFHPCLITHLTYFDDGETGAIFHFSLSAKDGNHKKISRLGYHRKRNWPFWYFGGKSLFLPTKRFATNLASNSDWRCCDQTSNVFLSRSNQNLTRFIPNIFQIVSVLTLTCFLVPAGLPLVIKTPDPIVGKNLLTAILHFL